MGQGQLLWTYSQLEERRITDDLVGDTCGLRCEYSVQALQQWMRDAINLETES